MICRMKAGWLVIGDVQRRPAWVGYDWATARRFDPAQDGPFVERVRRHLNSSSPA